MSIMLRIRATHLALALVAIFGVIFGVIDAALAGRPAFPLDDAWIHLQFAARLAAGDGLAYSGEGWVTGSTAPLWSALVSIGGLLPGSFMLLWSEALAALALAVAVLGAHRLARELLPRGDRSSRHLAATAALLVATTPWLLWSAAAGMEVTTFVCLALWGTVWHLRELRSDRSALPRSAVLLGAASLARPEGALLLALALGERWLQCRRIPGSDPGFDRERLLGALRATVVAFLVLVPTLVFYRVAGGSFLPTTFWAKAGGPLDPWPDTRYLFLVLNFFARAQPVAMLLASGGVLVLLSRLRGRHDRGLLPAAWLLAQPVVYSLMTRPGTSPPMGNFGRYYFPLIPVVVVLALLALAPHARRLRRLGLFVPLLCLLFVAQLPGLIDLTAGYSRHVFDVETSDVAAAQWLAPRLDPQAMLAVQDVGALAFFLPNEVVDLAGLTSPEIRSVLFGGATNPDDIGDWQQRLYGYLRAREVDYLVVFEGHYPAIVRAPGFQILHALHNPDNQTMAGDVLLILRTPWCRYPLTQPPASSTSPLSPAS